MNHLIMSVSTQEFLAQIGRNLTKAMTDPQNHDILILALVCCCPMLQRGLCKWHVPNFQGSSV